MAKVGRGGTRYCWKGERRGGGEGQVAGSEFTACAVMTESSVAYKYSLSKSILDT